MSLVSEANDHARTRMGFYGEVEKHFKNSFLGMLLVRGITEDLAGIIRDNPVFVEQDDGTCTWVLHIGSIKLLVKDATDIAVHVHTNEGQRCGLLIYIWQTDVDATLTAEFQMIGDFGRTTEFKVPLPATLGHPLCAMLSELKRIINHSTDDNVSAKIKAWAKKQK